MATCSIAWTRAWGALDEATRTALTGAGLTDPILMSGTFDAGDALRSDLLNFLEALQLAGEEALTTTERLDALCNLHAASTAPAEEHADRMARTNDAVLYDDLTALARHAERKARERTAAVAQAEHVAALPSHWQGKRYRRQEQELNPHEREEAELKAVDRWSKEVLGLLTEPGTNLPFAEAARRARAGSSSASLLRCCRGSGPTP